MELRVGKTYKITEKINSGAFGQVFKGINEKTKMEVAIKLEPVSTKHPQLFFEFKLYQYLAAETMVLDRGIPNVYYCSTENDYNIMVMDLLGPSLEELFTRQKRKFSIKTTLILADQLLNRIEFIHSKGFLHRDVKPDNFLIGTGRNLSKVFCVDFGLAKRYLKDGQHIDYREGKCLTGTARYASINTHMGIEQGRADDLESLAYMLLYFLRGSLPWQNLKANNKKEKYERIMEKKLSTFVADLIEGFPEEFGIYLLYTRNLKFDEQPDYEYMKNLFKDLFQRLGYENDFVYDWTKPKDSARRLQNKAIQNIIQQNLQKSPSKQN